MNVLFFTSAAGFPIVLSDRTFNPAPVVGGFVLRDDPDARAACLSAGIGYMIKDLNEIEFLPQDTEDATE